MRLSILVCALAAMLAASPLAAQTITYHQDPLYDPLNANDPHPMDELMTLAKEGDIRAQFILGDLYAKGKGGLKKDTKKAQHWFDESAKAGYGPSFIRLAALARRKGDMIAAYSWYDLGADIARGKDARYAASARDALVRDEKINSDEIKIARARSTEWKRARTAEASEKKAADIPAAKPAGKNAGRTAGTAEKPSSHMTSAPSRKEPRYND